MQIFLKIYLVDFVAELLLAVEQIVELVRDFSGLHYHVERLDFPIGRAVFLVLLQCDPVVYSRVYWMKKFKKTNLMAKRCN